MDNKKKVILGVSLVALYSIYKGLSNQNPPKYGFEWIKKLKDEEWEIEREIIRKKYCNPDYSDSERSEFQILLRLFDKVKSDRDWNGIKPYGPAYHREHGYNLYKP